MLCAISSVAVDLNVCVCVWQKWKSSCIDNRIHKRLEQSIEKTQEKEKELIRMVHIRTHCAPFIFFIHSVVTKSHGTHFEPIDIFALYLFPSGHIFNRCIYMIFFCSSFQLLFPFSILIYSLSWAKRPYSPDKRPYSVQAFSPWSSFNTYGIRIWVAIRDLESATAAAVIIIVVALIRMFSICELQNYKH